MDDRPPPATLGAQHDVRRVADGTVTVHDNRTGLSGSPRAARYDGFLYRAIPVRRSEVAAAQLRQGMDAMFPR